MTVYKCSNCGSSKPESEFYTQTRFKDRQPYTVVRTWKCRACTLDYMSGSRALRKPHVPDPCWDSSALLQRSESRWDRLVAARKKADSKAKSARAKARAARYQPPITL